MAKKGITKKEEAAKAAAKKAAAKKKKAAAAKVAAKKSAAAKRLEKRAKAAKKETVVAPEAAGVVAVGAEAEEIAENGKPVVEEGDQEALLVGDVEALPVINSHDQIYTCMRTVGDYTDPQVGVISGKDLKKEMGTLFESGYQFIDVLSAGFTRVGDRVLFILGKPRDGKLEYSEFHLIRRTIGLIEGAVTGFDADAWLNHKIDFDGWRLFKTIILATPSEGIDIIWILVR